MKGNLYRLFVEPFSCDAFEVAHEGGHTVLRTYHLCVDGRYHVRYTLKAWQEQLHGSREWGDLYSELVTESMSIRNDTEPARTPCDGSCRREFDLEAFAREELRYWDFNDPGSSEETVAYLRGASSDLLARRFYHHEQEDGDGHLWIACTGTEHFQYSILEYGMPGFFTNWPCDGTCEARTVIIPSPVTRFLRARGIL